MSDNKTIYQKTIVRLYHNPSYGKAIGEKRRNQFLFNGSVEFPDLGEKLFVDLANLDHMQTAFSLTHYASYKDLIFGMISDQKYDPFEQDRFFAAQLKYVRPTRQYINGFLLYDAVRGQSYVIQFDEEHDSLIVREKIPITACFGEKKGKSPDYFGTNYDMELGVPKTSNSVSTADKIKSLGIKIEV